MSWLGRCAGFIAELHAGSGFTAPSSAEWPEVNGVQNRLRTLWLMSTTE